MPRGRALFVHLRRRACALLLAAARLSRGSHWPDYTTADVEREAGTEKSCAPLCTVSCVHRVALLDRLRVRPLETLDEMLPSDARAPLSVRTLRWLFLTSRHRDSVPFAGLPASRLEPWIVPKRNA